MSSINEAIPLRDLRKIASLEESAVDLEYKANTMLFEAQDRRLRAEAIREGYEALVAEHGIDVCARMAEEADDREWQRPKGVA